MEFFRIKQDIPFMRHAKMLNLASLGMFVVAVFFLFYKGLHLSVEFTGGTLMEFRSTKVIDLNAVRKQLDLVGYENAQAQAFGSAHEILIQLPLNANKPVGQQTAEVVQVLSKLDDSTSLVRTEYIGPQIGSELANDGILALVFVVIFVIIYLSFRFEWKFALAGIIANLHDVVIILGFFAFFQWEFSLSVLAATLAVLGYSVNESVIIFDRIRENFRKFRKMDTVEIINNAITATISRTIITHGSTQLVVLSMYFFGGPTLHYFALALTIGIVCGIYSSVFVAASIAMWLRIKREDLIKNTRASHASDDPNSGAQV
ncbi:MAG: protein translocase subunit SecF [Gammaproteobacteria bacterium]|nr:protein translocase subunit SecF [Gammaproteobacteria bacterium]